jgi:hypothetical protein
MHTHPPRAAVAARNVSLSGVRATLLAVAGDARAGAAFLRTGRPAGAGLDPQATAQMLPRVKAGSTVVDTEWCACRGRKGREGKGREERHPVGSGRGRSGGLGAQPLKRGRQLRVGRVPWSKGCTVEADFGTNDMRGGGWVSGAPALAAARPGRRQIWSARRALPPRPSGHRGLFSLLGP